MKTENKMVQLIQEFRKELVRQFQCTSELRLYEFIAQVQALAVATSDLSNVSEPAFRPFLPAPEVTIEDLEIDADDNAWFELFNQSGFGRFEFDIEFEEGYYAQGIQFDFVNQEQFARLVTPSAQRSLEYYTHYLGNEYWQDILEYATSSIWGELRELKITNIRIEMSEASSTGGVLNRT